MKPFTRSIRESQYSAYADYKVHGFWPDSSISVLTQTLNGYKWEEPRINWASGGRDPTEEPDGSIAAYCFALAIQDAVKLARKWRKKYTDKKTSPKIKLKLP